MLQQLLQKCHVERWLLVALVAALLPGCMRAQQGLIRARQVVVINETPPGGAAVDLLIQDAVGTIVFQAGVNTGGQGNLVINSDAGPGFDSVAIIGQEGAVMIQLADDAAGAVRMSLGIETDAGVLKFYDGANRTIEIDGDEAGVNMFRIFTTLPTEAIAMGIDGVDQGIIALDNAAGTVEVFIKGGTALGFGAHIELGRRGVASSGSTGVLTFHHKSVNTSSATIRASDASPGSNADLEFSTTGAVIPSLDSVTELGLSNRKWQGFHGLAATVYDASARPKAVLSVNAGGDGQLILVESGTGTGEVLLTALGATPDLEIDFESGGNGYPAEDDANSWGISGNAWNNVVSKLFTLENTSDVDKLTINIDGGGDPFISMIESGAGSSEEIRLAPQATDDNHDSLQINDDNGSARIRMGVEDSEGRAAFHDVSGVVRAIIGSSGTDGFVNVSSGASLNVLLVTSSTAANNSVWINSKKILGPQGAAVGSGTAPDGTYGTDEEQMLQDLCQAMEDHGLVANSVCS